MKYLNFILLPLAATLLNIGFVMLILPYNANAQPDVLVSSCEDCVNDGSTTVESYILSDGSISVGKDMETQYQKNVSRTTQKIGQDETDERTSPNLKRIPGTDFDAYVRADIATYYREEPGSRVEAVPSSPGQAGKFINMSPERVSLYWVGDHGQNVLIQEVEPWGAGGTATFPNHKFIFTKHGKPKDILCQFVVKKGISVNYCDPFESKYKIFKFSFPAQVTDLHKRSLDSLTPTQRKNYDDHLYNLEFGEMYQNFTGGSPWLTMYPPNPVKHKIWRADYFGQEHTIQTNETHFHKIPAKELFPGRKLSIEEQRDPSKIWEMYRDEGILNVTIKAVSCTPKAFEVRNFLSDAEVDHLLSIVKTKTLERSTTGGHVSNTRTSRTTWIPRESDLIVNTIFRRVADVLQLSESLLRMHSNDEAPGVMQRNKINEDLQIVHYDETQEYTAHHDFGYPTGMNIADKKSRSINFAMYLNTVPEGGETCFPRWRNAETSDPVKVKPEKGKALLFYMVNPDGNLEDLTQHAALPVITGEKYFANLWLHSFQ